MDVSRALATVEAGQPLPNANDGNALEIIRACAGSSTNASVVVETTTLDIVAGEPAVRHVETAIAAGCHVITANKGPIAFAYRRLRSRAAAGRVLFLFESSVMDGIPIFNLVRETLPAIDITGFRGVVNSTTNYILSALEQGDAFAPALARMQAEGVAEADPSLDVEGWDAAAKTAALANVLMDGDITPPMVRRTGLGPAVQDAARAALARGKRLRLVASASLVKGGQIDASVQLVELDRSDILANLTGMANALVLNTDLLGDIAVTQLTGGLTQTAYGLLSDLIAIRRRLPA